MKLILVNLVDEFDADDYSPSIVELLESEHRSDSRFYPSVVLLHYIVQILAASDFHWVLPPVIELVVHPHSSQRGMRRFESI